MAIVNNNGLTFKIFSSTNIQHFSVLDVYELFSLVSEDLEPSRIRAPDLHVVCSS
jgi:hypothetical protein